MGQGWEGTPHRLGPSPHSFTHSCDKYFLSKSCVSGAWDVTIDRKLPCLPGSHILAGVSEKKTRIKLIYEIIEHYDVLCEEMAECYDRE